MAVVPSSSRVPRSIRGSSFKPTSAICKKHLRSLPLARWLSANSQYSLADDTTPPESLSGREKINRNERKLTLCNYVASRSQVVAALRAQSRQKGA